MAKRKYETPQIISDSPLREDDRAHFHFDEFAITLARLVAAKGTRTPLVNVSANCTRPRSDR